MSYYDPKNGMIYPLMCAKDADGMANSVDPDKTAPLGPVWAGSALFAQPYLSKYMYVEFLR